MLLPAPPHVRISVRFSMLSSTATLRTATIVATANILDSFPLTCFHPSKNIPAMQRGYAGMMVVPQPRGLPPNGYWSNTEPVVVRSPPVTPPSPADTIQSRIDNIVVTTPSTANLLSPSLSNAATGGHRRSKIYCDKWVHEGVCAFTQRGCKYKHEMPSDKLTQHQLGLFQGYPHWWKKHQADLSRQREALPSETPKNSSQSNEYRGSNERYIGNPIVSAAGNTSCRGLSSDTGGQLPWRQNGEYSGESQLLGANSSVVRTTSRDMSGAMRNVMNVAANIPSRDLSPCPVSYESPFGPIAPPARSNATVFIRTDSRRGAPTGTNRH
ncbi:hypothetical protein F4824DRAFT_500389 [Ustulina deusta]|nr:hypothetical protein F4824DRAFT_500389 [Ustulina deusta]